MDYVKLELGNLVMISGGNNIGRVGTITQREPHPGSFEIVHIKVPGCWVEMEPHVVVSWCFSRFRLDFVFLNKPFQRSEVMLTLSMFGSITLIFVQ